MITLGHARYLPVTKPLPKWLFYVMFWTIIPPMIVVVMVWEITKGRILAFNRRRPLP